MRKRSGDDNTVNSRSRKKRKSRFAPVVVGGGDSDAVQAPRSTSAAITPQEAAARLRAIQASLGISLGASRIDAAPRDAGKQQRLDDTPSAAVEGASNPYLAHHRKNSESNSETNDAKSISKRAARGERGLQFTAQGKYVSLGKEMRARETRRTYIESKRRTRHFRKQRPQDEGIAAPSDEAAACSAISTDSPKIDLEPEPPMEWWDVAFLDKEHKRNAQCGHAEACDYSNLQLSNQKTFQYVQHPPVLAPGRTLPPPKPPPLYLTKKERKRIRRQARRRRLQETNEKIALGLIPPPEPKVKISNLMRVLKNEAVADPSKIEAKVREQIKKRETNHEMRNIARMLTPEERKAKNLKKYMEDAKGRIAVALFAVQNLSEPEGMAAQHRYKIDMGAQQNYLGGLTVVVNNRPDDGERALNLVVVEGGIKAVERFSKLMLRRIKWTKAVYGEISDPDDDTDITSDDDEDAEDGGRAKNRRIARKNWCSLVWKGTAAQKRFNGMTFEEHTTATKARNALANRNLAHFWDAVAGFRRD